MSCDACRWCRGTGRDRSEPHYRCPDCDGTGREDETCADCGEPLEGCACEQAKDSGSEDVTETEN